MSTIHSKLRNALMKFYGNSTDNDDSNDGDDGDDDDDGQRQTRASTQQIIK